MCYFYRSISQWLAVSIPKDHEKGIVQDETDMKEALKPSYLFFWSVQILAIGLSFYAHQCGFLITPDSTDYLAAAKSFRNDGSLLDSQGQPFVYWPPLFPIILSFFNDPMKGLVWINIVCQVLIGMAVYRLAFIFLKSNTYQAVFLSTSVLSVQFIMVSVFVWSDLIFIGLALWNFCAAISLIHKGKSNWALFLITGFLMCWQRNAGVFWTLPTVLWLLVSLPYSLKMRVIASLIAFAVTTFGFWYWNMVHPRQVNLLVGHLGADTARQIMNNLYLIGAFFGKLYAPFYGWISCLLFGLILAVAIYNLRYQWKNNLSLKLMILILLTYASGFLLYDYLDPHDLDRYLSAIVPLIYLLTIMAAEGLSQRWPVRFQTPAHILLFLWAMYPIIRTIHNVHLWHSMSCHQ